MNKPAQRAKWVASCRGDHERIVLAIEEGDGDAAEQRMLRNLQGGGTRA